jgi:hypothetical protein
MRTVIEAIVETKGYPLYKQERRFYIQQDRGEIIGGPFKTREEAESEISTIFLYPVKES